MSHRLVNDDLYNLLKELSKEQILDVLLESLMNMHLCNTQTVTTVIAVELGMKKGDNGLWYAPVVKPERTIN